MRTRPRHLAAALGLAMDLLAGPARADGPGLAPFVDLETGLLWSGSHDVRAPADGSVFSLASGGDFQAAATPFVRVAAGAGWGRHTVLAGFAPVRLDGDGASGAPLQFRGVPFTADRGASYRYRLDSYRLAYRYAVVERPALTVAAGAGLLLRAAELRLSQPGQTAIARDTGLLPVASARVAWRFTEDLGLALDGDAGAAAGRRSVDASLALEFRTGELTFRGGYRVLASGLDAARFRDLAVFHHLLAGVSYRF